MYSGLQIPRDRVIDSGDYLIPGFCKSDSCPIFTQKRDWLLTSGVFGSDIQTDIHCGLLPIYGQNRDRENQLIISGV